MPAFKPLPPESLMSSLTPRQIVAELDKYVVGQHRAKRAVAIALRNRLRRRQLTPDMADDVAPKNILMIGPTGVGKTEIARRLARLAQSPFLKVEASRFTEVGYVGRDVESMVRDLVEIAVGMVRDERVREVRQAAEARAEERLLDLLLPPGPAMPAADGTAPEQPSQTRERLRAQLRAGKLDERTVEIDVRDSSMPLMQVVGGTSMEEIGLNLRDMMPGMFQGRRRSSTMNVPDARAHLIEEEQQKLVDMESVARTAIERVEESGILFVDEIRQDRRPRGRPRPRRQPGGRAARHPADRRGHHRQHQARDGADRSRAVHRGRGVPRLEAVGPHPRVAGPVPDPGGTRRARARRVRPHPARAPQRPDRAVPRRCSPPRASISSSPTMRSSGWRNWRRW